MMEKKTIIIIVSVIAVAVVATGLGVLIWWLLWEDYGFTLIELNGEGIGTTEYTAAITRIDDVGDVFWWFYPSTAAAAASKPLLLWLDGVTGIPPSLLANFGMIGPYDFNLNARENSWIDEFNLLFVDAPLGTGFSIPENKTTIPSNLDENADHLILTLHSFFRRHRGYSGTPLYIIGQGSGAQLALQLAIRLNDVNFSHNLRGVVLANGIVSPALALSKLGFYLEEMGYIDYVGREAIEDYSSEMTSLINEGSYAEAFDQFLSLGDFVNSEAETVAVNLGHIVEKLTRPSATTKWSRMSDHFGQKNYLQSISGQDLYSFMDGTVAEALGISHDTEYDGSRLEALQASKETFMIPTVDKVEYILQNTDLTVSIFNGNLDAVSNTPGTLRIYCHSDDVHRLTRKFTINAYRAGQLEWVDNLQWDGQEEFRNSTRQTLVVNRLVEGYFRVTSRLRFYWMNAAGQWVALDSPAAMRRVIQLITES